MSFEVKTADTFERPAKRLKKKYPSFKSDLDQLITSLETEPEQGVLLSLGFRKIRMAISSKGKGKSSGARVITLVKVTETTVTLVTVYDKSDRAALTDAELRELREGLG